MFFSFMLDSTAGGRNNGRPHSFLSGQKAEINFVLQTAGTVY